MSKILKFILLSLTILLGIGIGIVVVLFMQSSETKADGPTIKDMNDFSYATPEITTDLQDGRFVRIEFLVIADGKDAMEELEQREFQVKNILIKNLSLMSSSDFSEGLSELEVSIEEELNKILDGGLVTDVYTTNKILQ